jgi:hypothetical protein
VSDQQKPQGRAPRPGAGDPARTQQIPRLDADGKPVSSSAQSGAKSGGAAKDAPAKSAANRRPAGPARPASSSRGRQESGASAPATPKRPEPAKRPDPAKKAAPAKKGAAGRPASSTPTAADYARTTGSDAATTSVIPAVKDEVPPRTPAPGTAPSATPSSAAGRQARLRLTHVEPWSVTRLAFVVSVALMIVSVVAVAIFWLVLDLTGIWDQLNGTVTNVLSDSEGSFDLTDYLGLGRLVGLTLVLSAVNVVLMTAIATIAAHLYNLAAQLLGGIEVTFTDH